MHCDELNFDFDIQEGYTLIEKNDYSKYGIDPSTLVIMIKENSLEPCTLSLNRDDEFEDEDDFLALIDLNGRNMEKLGMKVLSVDETTNNGKKMHVMKSMFRNLQFISLFFPIRNVLVCCSFEEDESGTKDAALNLISSIKEC